MALTVMTFTPDVEYDYEDNLGVSIISYAGQNKEQRVQNTDIEYRTYSWPISRVSDIREDVDDFFKAMYRKKTSFLIHDPKDNRNTGTFLGVAISGQTGFNLPTTGDHKREYPVTTAGSFTLRIGGATYVGDLTVYRDGRRVAFDSVPTTGLSGQSVIGVYSYYRRVRLKADYRWTALAPNWFNAKLTLQEVPE